MKSVKKPLRNTGEVRQMKVTAEVSGRRIAVYVNGARGRDLTPKEARELAIGLDDGARRQLEEAADEIEGR